MKILIMNVWDRNRGDEALTRAIVTLLKRVEPKCEIDLLPIYSRPLDFEVPGANIVHGRYGSNYMSRYILVIDRILSPLATLGRGQRILRICKRRLKYLCAVLLEKMGYPHARFLRQYDCVFFAPQGQTISAGHVFLKPAIHSLSAVKRYGIPYFIMGVSMGPFDGLSKKEKVAIKNVLLHAERIVVREDISRQYLEEAFPEVAGIESAIDIVFTLNKTEEDRKAAFELFTKELAKQVRHARIGACISLTPQNPSRALTDNKSYFEDYLTKMIKFFDYVVEKTGQRLLLLPHIDRDYKVFNRIVEQMENGAMVECARLGFNDRIHQRIIGELDFFICTRYHPAIFAISEQVPFMAIMQHYKVEGLLQKLSLEGVSCWQDDSLQKYKDVFDCVWRNRKDIRKALKKARLRALELASIYLILLQERLHAR